MGWGGVKENTSQDSEHIAMAHEDPGLAPPRIHELVFPVSCGTMAQVVLLLCWYVWKEHNDTKGPAETEPI